MKIRVKEICKQQGITISNLAKKMGIKQESLSRTINGNPTLSSLENIAEALNVKVSDLVKEGEESMSLTCPKCGAGLELCVKE